ncbi:hypothetical protein M0813_13225 [Anaeramoeba flamelloides]|uniref:Uncharacterized protein n=1 Tax=Anaeramoeba flamelloides TaxID=1746091 RepID=A0ABQ8ZA94_9EUKA|nr:hypothetical protein M0813_13225 [Anaeramoeba flamelloides]
MDVVNIFAFFLTVFVQYIKILKRVGIKESLFILFQSRPVQISQVKSVLLQEKAPSLQINEFIPNCHYQHLRLSNGAKKLLTTENAGGNSIISESMSFEVLKRLFGAKLIATEMEIEYKIPNVPITDYIIQVEETKIGVSVTRSMKWPSTSKYTNLDAHKLLKRKLSGVIKSNTNLKKPYFEKQILHIWSPSASVTEILSQVWQNEINDDLKSNTFVLITTAEKNADWIFWNIYQKKN